jgi:hypothetical protein
MGRKGVTFVLLLASLLWLGMLVAGCVSRTSDGGGHFTDGPNSSATAIISDPPSPPFCPKLPPPDSQTSVVAIQTGDVAALVAAARSNSPGTTVLLDDGVYTLAPKQSVEAMVPHLVIRSKSGNRNGVVIQGGHNSIVVGASGVVIADVTLRQPHFHTVQVQGERGLSGTQVYNVHMVDAGKQFVKVNTGDGLSGRHADHGLVACSRIEYVSFSKGTDVTKPDYTNGVDILAGNGWVIRDNVFRRIRSQEGPAGPAILVWKNSMHTAILRNWIVDCWRGIALGLSPPDAFSRGGSHVVYDHQDGLVANNVFLALHEPADAAIENHFARNSRIFHNTVYKREGLSHGVPWAIEYRYPPTTAIIENNLTNQAIVKRDPPPIQDAVLGGNVIEAEATWFRNLLGEDIHLSRDAPAINQGLPLPDVVTDMDGDPRPAGSGYDAGADEVTDSSGSAQGKAAHPPGRS